MAMAVVEQIDFQAFDVVVAGDDVIKGKPDPEPYQTAADLLGVATSDCLAFEDSPTGLASAVAAGCHTIGIPNIVNLPDGPGRRIVPSLLDINVEELSSLRIENR